MPRKKREKGFMELMGKEVVDVKEVFDAALVEIVLQCVTPVAQFSKLHTARGKLVCKVLGSINNIWKRHPELTEKPGVKVPVGWLLLGRPRGDHGVLPGDRGRSRANPHLIVPDLDHTTGEQRPAEDRRKSKGSRG